MAVLHKLEDMQRGFDVHAEALLADIPNYTDIEPEIQISEVLLRVEVAD